ncbi:MAG: hypothetical protein ACTHQ3_15980 [Motilibacteraceae bacterium]
MNAYDECGYEWRDGWGEHRCHLLDDHDGKCRCKCDAETVPPTWRIERAGGAA